MSAVDQYLRALEKQRVDAQKAAGVQQLADLGFGGPKGT